MIVLGLTGGVGMGKSTCAQLLRQRSMCVVDTDDLARVVVEPGQPALGEIRNKFGAETIRPDGSLERSVLAQIVFSNAAARKELEGILHPRIRELWYQQIQSWRREGQTLATVVIPLLFETGAQRELDATICVACSTATQFERLSARGWTPEEIQQRISAQWSIEEKLAKANFVIWTEAGLDLHVLQLDRILSAVSSHRAPGS